MPADLLNGGAAVAWGEGELARFLTRRDRLLRWGWPEPQAEAMADRLARRDADEDDRRMCVECRHYGPRRRCAAAAAGRLLGAARTLEPVPDVLQRCEEFRAQEGATDAA